MSTLREIAAMGATGFAGAAFEADMYGQGYGAPAGGNFDEAANRVFTDGFAVARNVALFFAAPFVGLAYIVAFPFVGLGMLAWFGGKALMKYAVAKKAAEAGKRVGMIVAAPLLGLAFVMLLPLLGAGMLVWTGGRAALE